MPRKNTCRRNPHPARAPGVEFVPSFAPGTYYIVSQDSMNQQQYTEEERVWQMRWWLFRMGIIFSFVWMILMVGISMYVFVITKSFCSFLISAASAPAIEFIRRFANYLLPMDDKRFKLAVIREELKALKYWADKGSTGEGSAKKANHSRVL